MLCIFETAWSRAFQKCIFWTIFLKTFRAQELSIDVSFVIFWDLEGGQIDLAPPQCILVFKNPSRDRVKMRNEKQNSYFFLIVLRNLAQRGNFVFPFRQALIYVF